MRYIGGKSRQANKIKSAILSDTGARSVYLEPFLGGGSVAAVMVPEFQYAFLGDIHEDLTLLWRAAIMGWEPPVVISRELYEALRSATPSPIRGFVGFAASYNGKWWGGYGPVAAAAGRDYVAESCRSLSSKAAGMAGATIKNVGYQGWEPQPGWVVYCDPPYADTMKYQGTPDFDHAAFWSDMERWSLAGVNVYVSEYAAPDGWVSILDINRAATVHHSGTKSHSEGLYKYVGIA
jgi:DNA adenine methylase